MSGIAGIYAEQRADALLARAMIARLGHRGPRGQEVRSGDRVAFAQARGHRAADEALPLRSSDGSIVLVADGALDGAAALRARLEGLGHRHQGDSDWELLLSAYAEYGEDLPRHIDGVYAFALYDSAARRVLLARDRFGARPLFLARTGSGWAFASELKGLLPALGAPAIDPRALAQYLQGRFSAGRQTMFAGVERVQPGELLIVDDHGEVERRRYWTLGGIPPAHIGATEASDGFDRLAREILPEYAGAGTLLLCDGAESAQLLALAGAAGTPPRATAGFAGDDAAAKLARHFGIRHETIGAPSPDELARHLPVAAWAADDLIFDPAAPARLMAAGALGSKPGMEHGPTASTLLSAAGGAEVFAGAARYRRGLLQGWIDRLFDPDTAGLRLEGAFQNMERVLFGPALHRTAPTWRAPYAQALEAFPRGWSALQRMQGLDLAVTLPEFTLPGIDRAAMACGLDWRAPWLDRRVVEFGFSLPDRIKTGGGVPGRRARGGFVERHVQALLPAELTHARLPRLSFRDWLSGEALARVGRILSASPPLRVWLRKEAVPQLIGSAGQGRPEAILRLGLLLQFALWHRIFIESDASRPPPCDPLAFLDR